MTAEIIHLDAPYKMNFYHKKMAESHDKAIAQMQESLRECHELRAAFEKQMRALIDMDDRAVATMNDILSDLERLTGLKMQDKTGDAA